MILIADGGSTKCDWVILDDHKNEIGQTQTRGLNPTVFTEEILRERLSSNSTLSEIKTAVTQIYFYGAGCGTEKPVALLRKVFKEFFIKATAEIKEDLAAAVYAVTQDPGLVCILGTGSNCCIFDGKTIETPIASLGYSVMDEASGNYFGKQLLRDYFYKKMPKHIAKKFETVNNLSPDFVKENLYKKENPNAYLANLSAFLFEENVKEAYIFELLKSGIEDFIENRLYYFKEINELPVHFVGSVAYYCKSVIEQCFQEKNLILGHIIRRPIDQLVSYHQSKT
ncbi:N-acetylglucosamine kinase [Mesonia sp. K7]|uniref:N-acetylglucosamine kinase n=1 Tax=Mesonia sp. K7 TaxID=2218606 RepID=UPI000DA6FA9F|nr:N-acetylglucosamine kinase [Mesonia sp. K7]PZD76918.1 N-acetylglucosamine kinase [Mesonia sp. K7]